MLQVFNEGKGALAVRLVDEGQPLKLTSSAAESIVKELNATNSRWYNQQPVSHIMRTGPLVISGGRGV